MQPMSQLDLTYYLKDLERRALRDRGLEARLGPCLLCVRLRRAFTVLFRTFRGAVAVAADQKP